MIRQGDRVCRIDGRRLWINGTFGLNFQIQSERSALRPRFAEIRYPLRGICRG